MGGECIFYFQNHVTLVRACFGFLAYKDQEIGLGGGGPPVCGMPFVFLMSRDVGEESSIEANVSLCCRRSLVFSALRHCR